MGPVVWARAPSGMTALVTLVVLAAGCARPVAVARPGDGRAVDGGHQAIRAGDYCDSEGSPFASVPPLTPLPADAVLVSATRCLFQPQPVPGDGEWLVRIDQRATSGLDALAAALRLPSEQPVAGQPCLTIGYGPIVISVTDTAGREIHPEVPHAACGPPLTAATDAIAALPWTTVSTTRIRQTRSELEVSSGCDGWWKPMIPLSADRHGTRVVRLKATARALRVCRYDLDSDPTNVISMRDGTAYRVGKLVSASTTDAAAGGELLRAAASAPRATGTCTKPEAPFAVVHPVGDSGSGITIERGGCYRILLDGENSLRHLDAALVTRLVG